MNRIPHLLLILLVQAGASCGQSSGPLAVSGVGVSANPANVLSAMMTAVVSQDSRGHINYAASDLPAEVTPDFELSSGTVSLPVLGLMPNTDYQLWMTVLGNDGSVVDGPSVQFRTSDFSLNVPTFQTDEQGAVEPGYTMLGWISLDGTSVPQAGPAIIVDHQGRVVWYRQLDNFVTDWQKQPDGTYTAAVNDVEVPELGYSGTLYYQLDNTGTVLRTWHAVGPWPTDNHELRLLPNGDALIMAVDERTMDLSPWGGRPDGTVLGDILERVTADGEVVFAWDAFDHLSINATDPLILAQLTGDSDLDFTHANAIDIMADGNYLVSLRHLSQVVKIDSRSGDIIWKLGGVDSNFAFEGDSLGGFSLQHGVRELPNGNILLFDNGDGHRPPQSRAVEYQLDLDRQVATLVWQFNPEPHLFGAAMGFTQRLSNGNTLITYGFLPRVQEVSPSGQVLWDLQAPDGTGWIYRAIRISSLY